MTTHFCNEDRTIFSKDLDLDAILSHDDDDHDHDHDHDDDNVSGHDLPEPAPHSKKLFPCSNAAAHQNQAGNYYHHYVCTNCSSLANAYLRKDPHGFLHSGHPFVKGQRFFPLCKECIDDAAAAATAAAAAAVEEQSTTTTTTNTTTSTTKQQQGCSCGDFLDETLCFKCKRAKINLATAKRDAEVERVKLGFAPWEDDNMMAFGNTNNNNNNNKSQSQSQSQSLFMRPILRCVCGEEDLDLGNGQEGFLRCAGCEGIVIKMAGRVWDPFAKDFVKIENKS